MSQDKSSGPSRLADRTPPSEPNAERFQARAWRRSFSEASTAKVVEATYGPAGLGGEAFPFFGGGFNAEQFGFQSLWRAEVDTSRENTKAFAKEQVILLS